VLIPVFVLFEVFCMCSALFFLFQKKGHTFAESVSYSIIVIFMVLSFIRQIFFITGIIFAATGMELFFLAFSITVIISQRSCIPDIFNTMENFGKKNFLVLCFLSACFLYMAIHAFLWVPQGFEKNLSLFGEGLNPTGFPPMNHIVLFHIFTGSNISYGTGIYSFLAYVSIGCSTYALSRRYSWPPTAFTVAILVLSMPRLVFQAIYPGTEIISLAAVLFCILAIYRSVEQPDLTDLILLGLGIFFVLSENITGLIFVPVLFGLACIVLFRRHGIVEWKIILKENLLSVFLAVLPCVIFSQSWLFLYNHLYKGSWSGGWSLILFNKDGIQGALANFIRYLFESLNFTAPVDVFFQWCFQWDLAQSLESFYDFLVRPSLGELGAAPAFHLTWSPDVIFSFGPVGFFLVIPALFYALGKGPRRLKAVAIAFFVYFYLVSLIFAWTPGNVKFLGIFYVCSGFSISYFLPPWRFTTFGKRIFQAGACILLFFTLIAAL